MMFGFTVLLGFVSMYISSCHTPLLQCFEKVLDVDLDELEDAAMGDSEQSNATRFFGGPIVPAEHSW